MQSRLLLILGRIVRSLWFRPMIYALAALVVLLLAPVMARLLPDGLMDMIGLSGVYDLLNALASTLLAVAIFSLGILASSLRATAQAATPRVRPLLAEEPSARGAISTFMGGFVYAVVGIVILSTGYYSDAARVLLFFITVAVILALIVALVRWIGRLSNLGGVSEAIDLAEKATRRSLCDLAIEPYFGGVPFQEPPAEGQTIFPKAPGFVQAIDVDDLSALAEELDMDFHVMARPGAFVGPGHPIVVASGALDDDQCRRLRGLFVTGSQRTFEADPRFGLVVLSEIASRALSPAVNDPGTAIDVLMTSTRLLCEWADVAKEARPKIRFPRLHFKSVSVEQLLEDAFRWIARDGAGSAEVMAWLLKGLRTLVAADPDRFGPAVRATAREAMARADGALTLPSDIRHLRSLALQIERS